MCGFAATETESDRLSKLAAAESGILFFTCPGTRGGRGNTGPDALFQELPQQGLAIAAGLRYRQTFPPLLKGLPKASVRETRDR